LGTQGQVDAVSSLEVAKIFLRPERLIKMKGASDNGDPARSDRRAAPPITRCSSEA
jgi:hypothetical protein